MKTAYTKKRAQQIIDIADLLKNEQYYLDDKKARQDLASIYKQVMNIGASFPPRQLSMNTSISTKLYKRVSRSCPYCVKPADMKKAVAKAIKYIKDYADVLQQWLDDNDYESLPNDIHQLRPTIK